MRFTRVTLFFISFIIALGFYQLASHFLSDVEPQTFQATEETMIDVAQLFAELVENDMEHGQLDTDRLRQVFEGAHQREFEAKIFKHLKQHVGIGVYLTDQKGVIIFDSEKTREGQDYSSKRDVALTLKGKYGARSTRNDESDSKTSILYVAAPVGDLKTPSGVLTVYKAQADALPMIHERKRVIYFACGLIGSGILILIAAVFLWLFRPIGKITEYARAIERGERPNKLPKLGIGREVNTLAHALESMREALEGRRYAEHYIQTLTHEMKSPLAAIRGAAELLDEEMPKATRHRFLENIRSETARTERLISRLLELSAIESKVRLETADILDLREVLSQAIEQARSLAELGGVTLDTRLPEAAVSLRGDPFILRAAITNLLENAIDFSPRGSTTEISISIVESDAVLTIRDHGPGIPTYAQERIFDRFYSLRHHSIGRKGTGLGLTLVKEAAELHGGSITLNSADGGGTIALFTLPLK